MRTWCSGISLLFHACRFSLPLPEARPCAYVFRFPLFGCAISIFSDGSFFIFARDVIEVRAGGKGGKICYHKGLKFFLVHPLQCCISIRVFIKVSMEKFSISLREFFKSTFFLWPTRRFRIQYLDGRSEFDVAAARTTWPHPQMRGRAAPAVLRLS